MSLRSAPHASEDDNSEAPTKGVNRRDFLRWAGLSVVTVGGGGAAEKIEKLLEGTGHEIDPDTEGDEADMNEHSENSHGMSTWLDIGTAGAVAGNFARHVLYKSAYQGIELGPDSAAEMNALAFGRIGALAAFGGHEGSHHANEEVAEIGHGLMPLPALVALSDATTTELKVDVDEIFGGIEMEGEAKINYDDPPRPELSDSKEQWEAYLEKVNSDLTEKVAQIAAVTSVLAPLGTTYTSSSLANTLKEDVLKILYEQSLALQVIEFNKSSTGEIPDKQILEAAARERANNLMNGAQGFSKLMFTLAANTNGTWGIGDPPEIYFAINHRKDPKTMAMAHALGAANSELYTVLLNGMWLAKAGLLSAKALPDFIAAQTKVLHTLWESATNGALRNVTFGNGSKVADRVIAALNVDNDPEGRLVEALKSVPRAKLQFSPRDYISSKLRFGHHAKVAAIADDITADPETFAIHHEGFPTLLEMLRSGNTKGLKSQLAAFEDKIQTDEALKLAEMAEAMMDVAPDSEEEMIPESPELEQEARHERALDITARIVKRYKDANSEEVESRLSAARSHLGVEGKAEPHELYSILQRVDDSTVRRAIAELTKLGGDEDVIPGLADTEGASTVGEAMEHAEHDVHFLSHSAKEVLWALLTQIPSVPAISRLVKIGLPKVAGVESGRKPSTDDLKRIITYMLPIEAAMSAFADNVAAYLFAENVLRSFFVDTFGEEVFDRSSHIPGVNVKGLIGIVAKMIAEQAGSMSKVGNGPNFSQERVELLEDDSRAQGVAVNRVSTNMGETLPQKNHFSAFANGSLVAASIALLHKTVDKITGQANTNSETDDGNDHVSQANTTRRRLFKRLLGGTA